MISLRRFTEQDASLIQQKQYTDMRISDIQELIAAWETNTCQGRHFEMYAIAVNDATVGSASLYEHTKSTVSIGIEVYPDERGKGYASEGMRLILNRARILGYRIVQDQVRADNESSIALHNSLGFETDGYLYKNAQGRDVLLYLLCL